MGAFAWLSQLHLVAQKHDVLGAQADVSGLDGRHRHFSPFWRMNEEAQNIIPIGICWIEEDGTIVLDLRRTADGINISMPSPERTIVLRAQDVTAARAEARARWESDRTDESDGYLVYQSDGVCVHGLNLRDPAEISRVKRTKTVRHVRTGQAR